MGASPDSATMYQQVYDDMLVPDVEAHARQQQLVWICIMFGKITFNLGLRASEDVHPAKSQVLF
jgi:hypothetical protein